MRKVDQSGLKTGQALTIILLLAAFILSSPLLVAIVAISQFLGALDVSFAPFRVAYKTVGQRFVKPNVITDNPEPHRFAMLVGSIFNGVATLALLSGASTVGWVLVWIVIVLANLNFWLNFCVGCLMYYQLNRFGVPGFKYAPIPD
ncbi:MAG: DUF4395 domain-containing protein [Anaerolineae bacterium]|uniref:DUF4395 domain-containing protein n=1 Tax=Candidatus Flexifilum breve TaxID=3140694 RepID=UPI001AC385B7|nr:DUF4395 domain-containing protein [Chloroflexota bacterium]MBN8636549.1 DUF4395 domain-containing protein [Anaerolineae bacterium]